MNTDSRLTYTSMTPTIRGAFSGPVSRIGAEARIGYCQPSDRSSRVVFYLSDAIHIDTRNPGLELDTWFVWDEERGALAVFGEAGETACGVVEILANYSNVPFSEYRGIWLSKSDMPEYASKISIRLHSRSYLELVAGEIARLVFGEGVPFSTQICFEERLSEGERRAKDTYNALDFDYDF